MGYSGRYHAASLVAVFIALAIGIVIGAGLADDVQTSADAELVDSLSSDLDDAEQRADDLDGEVKQEQEFSSRIYPAFVDNRLAGESVAIVGLGGLDDKTAAAVEGALAPTGAEVAARATIATPADVEGLVDAARPPLGARAPRQRRARAPRPPAWCRARRRQRASRQRRLRALLPLQRQAHGRRPDRDRASDLGELEAGERESTAALLSGIYAGVESGAGASVAVELSDTDPTLLGEASAAGISTVDDADLVAGQVAIVFSLLGAEGDFGIKDDVDSFLPDLVQPGQTAAP